jgi:hypothetical protein
MALRFTDSFDHYSTGDLLEKWTAVSIAASYAIGATGRRSTNALRFTGIAGSSRLLTKTLDAQPTWALGVAINVQALPASSGFSILGVLDAGSIQVSVQLNSTGTLSATRGGTTVLGTSTATLSAGAYAHVGLETTIHPSAGTVTVYLNGGAVLTLTGQNTRATANSSANQVGTGPMTSTPSSMTFDLDDFFACDGTGSAPQNAFLGDARIDCLFPSGDGSQSAWTPSSGTTHSTLVDETAPNDDTDYLSTATAGARDAQTLGDLPALGSVSIVGLVHWLSARKDDAGTRQVKSLVKSGATTVVGGTTHALSTSYLYYGEIWPLDPATSAAWTTTAVNALEAGAENV